MQTVDYAKLEEDGFFVLRGLIPKEDIAEFEEAIDRFSRSQIDRLKLPRRALEPFVDVFSQGGAYTDKIYRLLERLAVLNRMSVNLGEGLRANGFLAWAGIEVPLLWPDIRADIPHDTIRTLPVHQDFASMQCHRAWRLWIPLRPSNAYLGTMAVYPGTHTRGPFHHNYEDPEKPVIDPSLYEGVEPVVLDLPAGTAERCHLEALPLSMKL